MTKGTVRPREAISALVLLLAAVLPGMLASKVDAANLAVACRAISAEQADAVLTHEGGLISAGNRRYLAKDGFVLDASQTERYCRAENDSSISIILENEQTMDSYLLFVATFGSKDKADEFIARQIQNSHHFERGTTSTFSTSDLVVVTVTHSLPPNSPQ